MDSLKKIVVVVILLCTSLAIYSQNQQGFSVGYDIFLDDTDSEYRRYSKVFNSKGFTLGAFKRFREDNGAIKASALLSRESHEAIYINGVIGDGYRSSRSEIDFYKLHLEMLFELNINNFYLGIGVSLNSNVLAKASSTLYTDYGTDLIGLDFNESPIGEYKSHWIYACMPVSLEYQISISDKMNIGINPIYYLPILTNPLS